MSRAPQQWTTLAGVRTVIERKWRKGLILHDAIEPYGLFPMRISLQGPSATELSEKFAEARAWVKQYQAAEEKPPFRVEWTRCNNRVLGENELPAAVVFESASDCVRFLGKSKELDRFARLSGQALTRYPQLKSWILKNSFAVLNLAPVWGKMLRAADWMIAHPTPDIYLRQLSIEGVDTKFVENYKGALGEWLDLLLGPAAIDTAHCGAKGFERRYGFRAKPVTVRFRVLDKAFFVDGLSDLSVRADEFCALDLAVDTVFVTENDTNGLAFPMAKGAIVLFGRGYGFDALADAGWLKEKKIWYWGDIDTHGFAILSQFRTRFPHAESLLMDRQTLLAHKHLWVQESAPTDAVCANLTGNEQSLYQDIRHNRLGDRVRLEQEVIDYGLVMRRLSEIGVL
jgi:hypothetical protein